MPQPPFDAWVQSLRVTVGAVGQDFTEPTDDWEPVMFVCKGEEASVIPLPQESFDPDFKPILFAAIVELVRALEADRMAMIVSTWQVQPEKGAVDAAGGAEAWRDSQPRSLGDVPGRTEAVVLAAADQTSDVIWMAPINRSETEPPTLGKWESVKNPDGAVIDVVRQAVRV